MRTFTKQPKRNTVFTFHSNVTWNKSYRMDYQTYSNLVTV